MLQRLPRRTLLGQPGLLCVCVVLGACNGAHGSFPGQLWGQEEDRTGSRREMRRKHGEAQGLDKRVGPSPEPEEGAAQSRDEGGKVMVPSRGQPSISNAFPHLFLRPILSGDRVCKEVWREHGDGMARTEPAKGTTLSLIAGQGLYSGQVWVAEVKRP